MTVKTLKDFYDEQGNLWYNDSPVAMPNLGCEDPGDTFSVKNQQVGGTHYMRKAYQPWDIIEEWEMCFWSGNVLKYLLRYRYKNGLEDLKKARHYLDYLIEKEEKNATAVTRD